MKILYVINNAYNKGNGLAASCRRTVKRLIEAGEDVKLLSGRGENGEIPDFPLDDYIFPIFAGLIKKQGYTFAESDRDMIRKAVRWADVIHIEEAFPLEYVTCKIAEEEGKPLVGTYHLHPENMFASVGLEKSAILNGATLKLWKETVFDKCLILQCPTENVKARLSKKKFKSELRVISNGTIPDEQPPVPVDIDMEEGVYNIITTGRLSAEKKQKTLLKAACLSAYSDRIRLIFAGRGPMEKKLVNTAEKLFKKGKLKRRPVFGFYTLPELKWLYGKCALYVHCASVEVEGMSCMEAVQTGLVPIIAKGELTATAQFALNPQSVFRADKPKELAERIDYWLSDDERRKKEGEKYLGMEKDYDINKSIAALIQMYKDAVNMQRKSENKRIEEK